MFFNKIRHNKKSHKSHVDRTKPVITTVYHLAERYSKKPFIILTQRKNENEMERYEKENNPKNVHRNKVVPFYHQLELFTYKHV